MADSSPCSSCRHHQSGGDTLYRWASPRSESARAPGSWAWPCCSATVYFRPIPIAAELQPISQFDRCSAFRTPSLTRQSSAVHLERADEFHLASRRGAVTSSCSLGWACSSPLTITLKLSQGGLQAIRQLPAVRRTHLRDPRRSRVYSSTTASTRCKARRVAVTRCAVDWQGRLATRINDVGPVTIGVVLGAVVVAAVLFVMRRRQSTP